MRGKIVGEAYVQSCWKNNKKHFLDAKFVFVNFILFGSRLLYPFPLCCAGTVSEKPYNEHRNWLVGVGLNMLPIKVTQGRKNAKYIGEKKKYW